MKIYKVKNKLGIDNRLYSLSCGWVSLIDESYSLLFVPSVVSYETIVHQRNKRPVYLEYLMDFDIEKLPRQNIFYHNEKVCFCYPSSDTLLRIGVPDRRLIKIAEKIKNGEDIIHLQNQT